VGQLPWAGVQGAPGLQKKRPLSRGTRRGTPDRAPLEGSDTHKGDTRLPESGPSGGTGKLVEASAIRAEAGPRYDLDQG